MNNALPCCRKCFKSLIHLQISKRSYILKNRKSVKQYFLLAGMAVLVSCVGVTVSTAATLTDSTSVTVVNVTQFPQSYDITRWGGAWPSSPAAAIKPSGQEMYLNNVNFGTHNIAWNTTPYLTPYRPFPNTVNSMIAAVWSTDGGKTFKLQSWDYLVSRTHGKGLEHGMPNCWMGTMVHAICDRKPGECNGRYRSNLYFTEYPTGNTSCWGSL